jgi:hypothetical protein
MDLDLGPVPCPEDGCGATITCSLDDVTNGRTKTCRNGHAVKLVDQGGGARKVTKSLKDLDRSLAKLNRSFKI